MLNLEKIRSNKKLLVASILLTGVMACSSTDDEIDKTEPAELTDIEQQFKPNVLWSESGEGVSHYFSRLSPAVAYDKVFTASREGFAYAYDQESGDEIWEVDLRDENKDGGFFASKKSALLAGGPITGINKVFIGSENGQVFALDASTGEVSWRAKVRGEIISAPAFDSGSLVVNTTSGITTTLNASTGEELWSIEQDVPPLTLRGVSSPAVASGGVIIGASDGSLSVFVLENGQQGWTTEVGEATGSTELERVIDIDSKPLIYGDKVYSISVRGNLIAMDLRNGRVLWKRQYSSYRPLSVNGNTIYLTDVKGHVYAVDRNNGLERWSQLTLTNRNVTGPAVVNDHVVVGDFEGYLHWLNQDTGEIVARYHLDGSGIHATPATANDVLFVESRDGDLEAIKTP